MAKDDLTDTERRFYAAITDVVDDRAGHVKAEYEDSQKIAELCVAARREGVAMAKLAAWVQVYNPKKDERRSITRQAVDLMVAQFEGRVRRPTRRPRDEPENNGTGR